MSNKHWGRRSAPLCFLCPRHPLPAPPDTPRGPCGRSTHRRWGQGRPCGPTEAGRPSPVPRQSPCRPSDKGPASHTPTSPLQLSRFQKGPWVTVGAALWEPGVGVRVTRCPGSTAWAPPTPPGPCPAWLTGVGGEEPDALQPPRLITSPSVGWVCWSPSKETAVLRPWCGRGTTSRPHSCDGHSRPRAGEKRSQVQRPPGCSRSPWPGWTREVRRVSCVRHSLDLDPELRSGPHQALRLLPGARGKPREEGPPVRVRGELFSAALGQQLLSEGGNPGIQPQGSP